ncbi:TPA: hypothetical protein RTH03_001579 [Campylobacter jejuni]|nr:hypothetical protein [Campylobacter jejuni]HDZ5084680.1 hypothetical protein [Campylobacter jejuni]HDZ5086247.1 hypothetical protein [Campylobacter jejuni]HDZ5087891.1 hypothetical protein [Campylobacter jejuni]HDZ5091140.1 hypothetical protein [Campylobacter jejuni]
MSNKEQIRKLRDNAELAWASYGYFHYFLEQQKSLTLFGYKINQEK